MNYTDRYKILMNIVAQKGLDADLYMELGKVENMINLMEQGKMTPPPVPEAPLEPTMNQPQADMSQQQIGRYDNL